MIVTREVRAAAARRREEEAKIQAIEDQRLRAEQRSKWQRTEANAIKSRCEFAQRVAQGDFAPNDEVAGRLEVVQKTLYAAALHFGDWALTGLNYENGYKIDEAKLEQMTRMAALGAQLAQASHKITHAQATLKLKERALAFREKNSKIEIHAEQPHAPIEMAQNDEPVS
jgi:hypothetical protein